MILTFRSLHQHTQTPGMEINTRHTPFAGGFEWWQVNRVTSPATVSGNTFQSGQIKFAYLMHSSYGAAQFHNHYCQHPVSVPYRLGFQIGLGSVVCWLRHTISLALSLNGRTLWLAVRRTVDWFYAVALAVVIATTYLDTVRRRVFFPGDGSSYGELLWRN